MIPADCSSRKLIYRDIINWKSRAFIGGADARRYHQTVVEENQRTIELSGLIMTAMSLVGYQGYACLGSTSDGERNQGEDAAENDGSLDWQRLFQRRLPRVSSVSQCLAIADIQWHDSSFILLQKDDAFTPFAFTGFG